MRFFSAKLMHKYIPCTCAHTHTHTQATCGYEHIRRERGRGGLQHLLSLLLLLLLCLGERARSLSEKPLSLNPRGSVNSRNTLMLCYLLAL